MKWMHAVKLAEAYVTKLNGKQQCLPKAKDLMVLGEIQTVLNVVNLKKLPIKLVGIVENADLKGLRKIGLRLGFPEVKNPLEKVGARFVIHARKQKKIQEKDIVPLVEMRKKELGDLKTNKRIQTLFGKKELNITLDARQIHSISLRNLLEHLQIIILEMVISKDSHVKCAVT